MADTQTQAQTLTLNGGTAAQNRYLNYYNQLIKQMGNNTPQVTYQNIQVPDMPQMQPLGQSQKLSSYYNTLQAPASVSGQLNYTLPEVTAPTIAPLQQMAGQTVSAPEQIQVEKQTEADLARQISAYLRPYVDNAITSRIKQTKNYMADADVDAASRGMTRSTWLSDAKNRLAAAEASDIAAMENEYIGNLAKQVSTYYQNNLDRIAQADAQNVANKMSVLEANANRLQQASANNAQWANNRASELAEYGYNTQLANTANKKDMLSLAQQAALADIENQTEWASLGLNAYSTDIDRENAINQYNNTLQNNAQMAYWEALTNAAQTDAANKLNLALSDRDYYNQLMQLAMNYAGQLYATNPVTNTVTLPGGTVYITDDSKAVTSAFANKYGGGVGVPAGRVGGNINMKS